MFAVLIALATTIPLWSAAIGLLATVAISGIQRLTKRESAAYLADRVLLFGIYKLPCEDVLPRLFVQPLSLGAIPLALIGLAISASHVLQGNFSLIVLIGSATSAFALALLTRIHQVAWLYWLSLAATGFTVHAAAQGHRFESWRTDDALSGHLAIAAALSLLGWCVASLYAAWCGAMLKRVAEEQEGAYLAKRAFYAGLLYDAVSIIAAVTLTAVTVMYLGNEGSPRLLSLAAIQASILFALALSSTDHKLDRIFR